MTWLYLPSAYATDTEDSNSDSDSTEYQPWLGLVPACASEAFRQLRERLNR